MATNDAAKELVDLAERHLAELGHNDPSYIWAVVSLALSIEWADTDRSVCPECAKRYVRRGHAICTECEEQRERQLEFKRRWWANSGNEWRAEWLATRKSNDE